MLQCDFCSGNNFKEAYRVPESERDTIVCVCEKCGLVQSISKKKKKEREIRISSGADWGNIRHAKRLRINKLLPILTDLPVKKFKNILDVGANRGDFIEWTTKNTKANITAVEPDSNVTALYKKKKHIHLYEERLENVQLQDNLYDFVYCVHTLEHADSASLMLQQIAKSMKIGGLLLLEVPNIVVIEDTDIVEEFFIDKHKFHFTREILIGYVEQLGFSVIKGKNDTDRGNITLLLKKKKEVSVIKFPVSGNKVKNQLTMLEKYQKSLKANREKLKEISDKLYEFMGRQKVTFWGGGRIFDALVKYGGLKTDRLTDVIDKFLAPLTNEVNGVKLTTPEVLRSRTPDVVIILAKSSTDEIEKEVRRYGVRHVIRFSDLITQ